MDKYYTFPWGAQVGTYLDGDKRISILSVDGKYVADIYRQTAHSNEGDWKAIATLITISPELLAVAKAMSEGKADSVKELAQSLVALLDVPESEGFDFWQEVDNLANSV